MSAYELINLLDFRDEKTYNLDDYYVYVDSIDKIKSMSSDDLVKLSNDVLKYFSFVFDSFEGFFSYVLHLYKNKGKEVAKECIYERFSDDSIESDMNISNRNKLYEETSLKLKNIFSNIILEWDNGRDGMHYFEELDLVLKSLHSFKDSIVKVLNNKDFLVNFLECVLDKIKNDVKEEKAMNFDKDLNKLVSLINKAFEIDSNVDVRGVLLNKLTLGSEFSRMGCYNNGLVLLVNKYANKGKSDIVFSNCTNNDLEVLKELLYDYINNAPNFDEIVTYFRYYVSSYLNYYFDYDNNSKNCNVYIANLSSLFEAIDCYSLIFELFMGDIKINYSFSNRSFTNKFRKGIERLESYNYNKQEINDILFNYQEINAKGKK